MQVVADQGRGSHQLSHSEAQERRIEEELRTRERERDTDGPQADRPAPYASRFAVEPEEGHPRGEDACVGLRGAEAVV
jgi:hypothetical protein